jgi:hypothetical protein
MFDAPRQLVFAAVATSSFVLHSHRWEAGDHRCCGAVITAAIGTPVHLPVDEPGQIAINYFRKLAWREALRSGYTRQFQQIGREKHHAG